MRGLALWREIEPFGTTVPFGGQTDEKILPVLFFNCFVPKTGLRYNKHFFEEMVEGRELQPFVALSQSTIDWHPSLCL